LVATNTSLSERGKPTLPLMRSNTSSKPYSLAVTTKNPTNCWVSSLRIHPVQQHENPPEEDINTSMRLDSIFERNSPFTQQQLKNITACTQFLEESKGLPLMKVLSSGYGDFAKVKVRHRKKKGRFIDTFNEALDVSKLRQRAIFANNNTVHCESDEDLYYIFPKNGYRFVYSEEVHDSGEAYKEVFESLLSKFDDNHEKAVTITTELLKYTYTNENLAEGINRKAEVIVYNVPFYYAVKEDIIDYNKLLNLLGE